LVLLVFRRPVAASRDAQRTNLPVQSGQGERLRSESGRRIVLAGVMLVVGGAALPIAAL
jgi:hypothetical protein